MPLCFARMRLPALIFSLAAVYALPQGCSTMSNQPPTQPSRAVVAVQFLYFDGCPMTPRMRASLHAAAERIGPHVQVVEIDLRSLPDDDLRRGYGSPTVLVLGEDLAGQPSPGATELACRIYSSGLPDSTEIERLINLRVAGRDESPN